MVQSSDFSYRGPEFSSTTHFKWPTTSCKSPLRDPAVTFRYPHVNNTVHIIQNEVNIIQNELNSMPELWGLKGEKEWSKNSVTIASHCYKEDTRVLATCLDKKKKKKRKETRQDCQNKPSGLLKGIRDCEVHQRAICKYGNGRESYCSVQLMSS